MGGIGELEIAYNVMRGRYGNGEERKRRLESAGYNYSNVQSIVNLLVKYDIPVPPDDGRHIVDVSEHNGDIDWVKAKLYLSGVILRAQWSTTVDRKFKDHWADLHCLGIVPDVYFFSYALSSTQFKGELAALGSLLPNRYNGSVYMDFEELSIAYADSQGVKITIPLLNSFFNEFRSWGKTHNFNIGVYMNNNMYQLYYKDCDLSGFDIWWADWRKNATVPNFAKIHQFTASGSINGIPGPVDLSNIL